MKTVFWLTAGAGLGIALYVLASEKAGQGRILGPATKLRMLGGAASLTGKLKSSIDSLSSDNTMQTNRLLDRLIDTAQELLDPTGPRIRKAVHNA